jgi:glycosyltransferase involved in cell wall biosynthesis
MRALQQLGYAVSFVAAQDLTPNELAVADLENAGNACYQAPYYASVEEVLRRQANCFDLIYLHRISSASRYLALARQYCPNARILYSVADLSHVRLARQSAVEDRPELLAQSSRLRLEECTAAWSADAVLSHSTYEVGLLRTMVPSANVHLVPWAVPPCPTRVPFAKRQGIAFVGGYGHPPNLDAARFLVEEIMPLVWREYPALECLLVGSDMPAEIMQLARPGVVPVGHMEELSELFDRVRLTVAPLRYGAGIKGKVLASLAAGVPCVMTPVAAEGIDLPATLRDCVRASAVDLAAQIVRLHVDAAACQKVADEGLAFIQVGYSDHCVAETLKAAIEGGNVLANCGNLIVKSASA